MVFKNKNTAHRYASSIECVYPNINLLGKVQETTFGFSIGYDVLKHRSNLRCAKEIMVNKSIASCFINIPMNFSFMRCDISKHGKNT